MSDYATFKDGRFGFVSAQDIRSFNISTFGIGTGDIGIRGQIHTQKSNATQPFTITASINVEGSSGIITTAPFVLIPGEVNSFTVNNSVVRIDSTIYLTVRNHNLIPVMVSGIPTLMASNVLDGSFVITVGNSGNLNLTGPLEISYLILS